MRNLGEDALTGIDSCKKRGSGQQHLRLAQEQVTLVRQRIMEPRQDLGLRLGLEIHQGISGDEQIDA